MNAPLQQEPPSALITKLEVNSDPGKHLDWLARLMMMCVESSEVVSAEIFPPSNGEHEWVLVQRFHKVKQVESWLKSAGHQRLLDELSPYLESKEVSISESLDPAYAAKGDISEAVATHVKEGHEKAYFARERKYQSAQARMPGYRGAYVQPPANGAAGNWITIIRFDSPNAMERWFSSDERKKLVAEAGPHVNSTDFQNVTTSFPGWFPAEETGSQGPANWKTALLILLGLYPSVMLVIKYFLPLMQGYSPALNNFIGNIITVSFTTWVSMPLFIKFYNSWLFPNESTPKWVSPVSVLSILFFLALEVLFFWSFF